MSEVILSCPASREKKAMSQRRRTQLVEWAFRLLLVAFVALWVIYPPQTATPMAPAGTLAATRG